MTPQDTLAAGYRMAGQMIRRMTDDLSPAEFRHQPTAGGGSVGCAPSWHCQQARRVEGSWYRIAFQAVGVQEDSSLGGLPQGPRRCQFKELIAQAAHIPVAKLAPIKPIPSTDV